MNIVNLARNLNGAEYFFETGKLAFRTDASIFAKAGDTTVLVTITVDQNKVDNDFFPLTIEFVEKMYSTGKISTNRFVKREKFPSDSAILKARAIDRSIRPYFPVNFKNPVQVIVTLLSYDEINDPVPLAINATSTALGISSVPFDFPVSSVRVSKNESGFVANPGVNSLKDSELDLLFSGRQNEVSMVEVESKQVKDDDMKKAFDFAVENFKTYTDFQNDFIAEFKSKNKSLEKLVVPMEVDYSEILKKINVGEEELNVKLVDALFTHDDTVYQQKIAEIKKDLIEKLSEFEEFTKPGLVVEELVYKFSKKITRSGVLKENKRLSGRGMDEIREIKAEVNSLPIVHGSALFSRGITQVLSITTLGSLSDVEKQESYLGDEERYYIHHYNGPSYSLGEANRYGYMPGRREIGHGELAEKAIKAVLPKTSDFPYTIRVVSEVLSQSGSSSMASTCGSCLSLMDAGVPISAPVAGIAIGLVTEDNFEYSKGKYQLVTDMADKEDFFGDMDFKVTGTSSGITAIQMDNKLGGIHIEILKEAIDKASVGRNFVLSKMNEVLSSPRTELKPSAPQVKQLQINPERIGELIGPGGKMIKSITEKTGAKVDIADGGLVTISSSNLESLNLAFKMIDGLVGDLIIGKVYDAVVEGIKEYGVFVQIGDSHSGLVHISEMKIEPNTMPEKIYNLGDKVKVMVYGKDAAGRWQLSTKRVTD